MAKMSFAVRWDIRISLLGMTIKMLSMKMNGDSKSKKHHVATFHIRSVLTCRVSPVLVSNADTGCSRTRETQRTVTKMFTSECQALD